MANTLLSDWVPMVGYRPDVFCEYKRSDYPSVRFEGCLKIGDRYLTAPTQADDLLHLCTTSNGVLTLLKICWQYSCLWRNIML